MPTTSAAAPPAAPSSSSSAAPSAPCGASSNGRQRRTYAPAAAQTRGAAPFSIRRASSLAAAGGAGESEAGSAPYTSGWTGGRQVPGEVVRSRGRVGRAGVACELSTASSTRVHCCTERARRTRPALCGARRARSLAQWVLDGHRSLPASQGPQAAHTATATGLGLSWMGCCSCVLMFAAPQPPCRGAYAVTEAPRLAGLWAGSATHLEHKRDAPPCRAPTRLAYMHTCTQDTKEGWVQAQIWELEETRYRQQVLAPQDVPQQTLYHTADSVASGTGCGRR